MNLLNEYFPNIQLIKEIQIIVNSTNNDLCNNIMNKKFFDKSNYTLIDGYSECLEYACNNGYMKCCSCTDAASKGHFYCLRNFHENGYLLREVICETAAKNGHLNCLIYARENGCPWDEETCTNASCGGYLYCLIYAHENGCPWDKETCSNAAENGHLDCLIYARENSCSWDKETCSNAAENGHLDCLIYAHKNGCPLDKNICKIAADYGHFDCLNYARENGCDWDKLECEYDYDNKWNLNYDLDQNIYKIINLDNGDIILKKVSLNNITSAKNIYKINKLDDGDIILYPVLSYSLLLTLQELIDSYTVKQTTEKKHKYKSYKQKILPKYNIENKKTKIKQYKNMK